MNTTTMREIQFNPEHNESMESARKQLTQMASEQQKVIDNANANLKRVDIRAGIRGETSEISEERKANEDVIVEAKEALAEINNDVGEVDAAKAAIVQAKELERLRERAHGIEINLGIDITREPTVAMQMYSAMANQCLYQLESGQDYFVNLARQVHSRRAGDESEGGAWSEVNAEFSSRDEERLAEMEATRDTLKAYLHALREHYDDARAYLPDEATFVPQFLRQSRADIRASIERRRAERAQQQAAQDQQTQNAAASWAKQVDDAGLPF